MVGWVITSLRMVNVSRKPSIHTAASYSFGQPEESITDHVSANNRHLFLRALKAEKFQIKPTADVEPVKGSLPYSSIVVLFIFCCCCLVYHHVLMKEGSALGSLCENPNPIHESAIFSKGPRSSPA